MNMYKICTSKEQSKKLIELGIDVNTADMFWTYDFTVNDINGINVISNKLKPEENDIPAWSLTALFSILPKSAYLKKGSVTELCYITLPVELISSDWKFEPIDACYEMIIKLKEQNLL